VREQVHDQPPSYDRLVVHARMGPRANPCPDRGTHGCGSIRVCYSTGMDPRRNRLRYVGAPVRASLRFVKRQSISYILATRAGPASVSRGRASAVVRPPRPRDQHHTEAHVSQRRSCLWSIYGPYDAGDPGWRVRLADLRLPDRGVLGAGPVTLTPAGLECPSATFANRGPGRSRIKRGSTSPSAPSSGKPAVLRSQPYSTPSLPGLIVGRASTAPNRKPPTLSKCITLIAHFLR
jgi:hypothetical protein